MPRIVGSCMLFIYALFTLAPSADPRWEGARFVGEVLVRASSPADARYVAASAPAIGSRHFLDKELYRVVEMNYGEEFRLAGGPGVIYSLPSRKRR